MRPQRFARWDPCPSQLERAQFTAEASSKLAASLCLCSGYRSALSYVLHPVCSSFCSSMLEMTTGQIKWQG